MYKNLNPNALGVSGRQSELIELALTYRFRGLKVDMGEAAKRAKSHGRDMAVQFVTSAEIHVGEFDLPISLGGDDDHFQAALAELREALDIAKELEATCCTCEVEAASDALPYHENFERHRARVSEVASVMSEFGVKLALGVDSVASNRKDKQFQFIQQAEDLLTFVKTIGSDNVGLLLDTWQWRIAGGTIDQLRDLTGEQILAVRLADISPETDLSHAEVEHRILPSEDGIVDNVEVIRLLSEKEYEGPVTLVPNPLCFTGKTRDAIVSQSSDLIDHLWAEAGLNKSGKPATEEPAAAAPAAAGEEA